MSEMQPHMKKRVGIALLLTGLGVVFAAVYYWATPTGGVIPSMPKVRIDSKQMDFAVKRFHQRAASVEITPFHEQLQAAFFALNSAEVSGSDASAINGLRQEFVQKTEIAQTARKERYLQFGDFLAKQFETELFQVLESAHAQGMEQVMHAKPDAYRKLIKLSGSFLQNSLRVGLISKDGTLHAERYVPQLLFRKRWRMLGDLPFLYQFLDIEAVADAAYQLQFGNPRNVDIRLKAAERVGEQDSRFDVDVAKALVLYQGKESKRALLYLENVLKNRPDDFVINEFHLFLSNDTK